MSPNLFREQARRQVEQNYIMEQKFCIIDSKMLFFIRHRLEKWSTNSPSSFIFFVPSFVYFCACLGFLPKEARTVRAHCTKFLETTKMSLGIWHLQGHNLLDLAILSLKVFIRVSLLLWVKFTQNVLESQV